MNLPEHLHDRANELLSLERDGADKKRLWAVIYNLVPYPYEGGWMVSTDISNTGVPIGVQGFGKAPVDAIMNFEQKMYSKTIKGATHENNHRNR